MTLNFTDKISNIKTKINYCNCRSLTPIGRITVIKSLLLSSLNHLFISLPNPNEKLLKDLNELFLNFIWTGSVLCQEYCNSGLKMVNINAFIAALKTTWLRKIITDNNSPWSIIIPTLFKKKRRGYFYRLRLSVRPLCYLLLNPWTKFNQIWCASYSHEWGAQRNFFLASPPGALGRGQKVKYHLISITKSISKIFIPNFVCVLTNERYKTYQTGFLFCRLGHALGVGLGGT